MTDLKNAVADYRHALAREKDIARERAEEILAEAMTHHREKLSKALHAAHAEGTPKDQLRRMVGAYNNSAVWNPIWDAYTPDTPVDLRTRGNNSKATRKNEVDRGWVSSEIGVLTFTDTGVTIAGVEWMDESGTKIGWDGVEDDDYALWKSHRLVVLDYLKSLGDDAPIHGQGDTA